GRRDHSRRHSHARLVAILRSRPRRKSIGDCTGDLSMLDNLGNLERTHSCGDLRAGDIGKQVVLMGWVARRRDFGELTFVDLRDRSGITQVVFNAELAPEAHAKAKDVRGEYVIAVTGTVVERAENTRNPKLATGDVEVHA